jgi:hypothetical protein
VKNVKKSLIQLDKMNRNVNDAEKKLKIGKLLDESTQISIHGYGKKNHFRNLGNKHILQLQNGKRIPLSRRQYAKIRKIINNRLI